MSHADFETLLYSVEDGIATVTLNRPEKMNAFTAQMRDDLVAAFDHTDADDAVRVVIVTGAGRAFCAGADLSGGGKTFDYAARGESARDRFKVGDVYRDGGGIATLRIFNSLKPVIGAINGAAVGIGMTMQLPMDIRMASTDARFGFVFARRGITPEAASTWFLPPPGRHADGAGMVLHRPPVRRAGSARPRPGAQPARARRTAARGPRAGARDRRQHRAGVGRADAPDAVAHGRGTTTR